jgi:hypothetical protein
MARQPDVFVRKLDPGEPQRLVKITRTARDRVRLRRAAIVLASVQGRSTAEVAAMFAATTQYQRRDRAVDDWCTTNDVGLVFTPTQASWLNWIESEFTALRYFTVDGSDYLPIHAAQEAAIAGYIRWANRHATPKRRFAPESKIRRPDCLPNVA